VKKSEFQRLIFECPYCRGKCQFRIAWHASMSQGGGANLSQLHGHITRYVLQCAACEEFVFVRTGSVSDPHPTESTVVDFFPPAGLTPHESLPAQVAVDYREASLCLSAGAWNACAAMCRRALQSCAKDKGADAKEDLFDQLKELRDRGDLSQTVYDMADAVRKKGNIGAHPGKDPVLNENLPERVARDVFAIVEQVFKYVYEYPSLAAAAGHAQ
jgi:Domain of unknown function (DUF4145)